MNRGLKTVLIFSHECAPYNRPESTVGAQRPAQFAKHLPEFGWRAIVLCCDSGVRRQATRQQLPELAASVKRQVSNAPPDESLIIPTPSLRWDGAVDGMWCLSQKNGGTLKRAKLLARKSLTFIKFTTGDYSQSWQPCGRLAADVVAESVGVDACVGEHSPDAGIFLARWFSRKHLVPWLADFRDPILQPLRPLAGALYRPIARRLLKSASGTVNVNRVWAEMDRELWGRRSWYIPNGFDPDEFADLARGGGDRGLTIAYAGRIDRTQRLDIFFEGMSLARRTAGEDRFDVSFVYRGVASERVEKMAADYGISDVVDVAPQINRRESLGILARADLLLLLSVAAPEREGRYFSRGFYPAKTFEYFGLRKPILCVPGDGALLEELIEETRTGLILRSPQDIARCIGGALELRKRGQEFSYQPEETAVARFTRRNLTRQLASALDAISGARTTP